ncbi:hypothetical protein EB796_024881 [Bugula neritina]|uniref:AQP4 n=1 Tax=Bugula neritina TaxID=10212 RepID=A0A7J7ITB7_BUGNE|nr:hypothetical protein EB796_024881 [Bugula neritina]
MSRLQTTLRDLKDLNVYRATLAEFLGVMFLVIIGCASPYGERTIDHTRISLSFGMSVATIVWVINNVSGGHINPAVTLAMLVTRKITMVRCILYIGAQMAGAIIGILILKGLICNWQLAYYTREQLNITECGLALNTLGKEVSPGQGFGVEVLITFMLVMTVFATCDQSRTDLHGSGPLAIGLAVTIGHLGFIEITGASMNPARSFGPAVVLGDYTNQWVYWVGPFVGAILAGVVYEFLFAGNAGTTKVVEFFTEVDYNPENEPFDEYPKTPRVASDIPT